MSFLFALFFSLFSHMSFYQYAHNNKKNDERQEKKKRLTSRKKYRIDLINKKFSFDISIKKS